MALRLSRAAPNANATLTVPAHRPVRLLMTSRDVIHSFFVPEFRIKQDVIPGRYTETWFEATKPGRYRIYCTEYCGTWHSQMVGEVVVHAEPAEFDKWLARPAGRAWPTGSTPAAGRVRRRAFRGDLVELRPAASPRRRAASSATRSTATPHIGPTWVDLYRRRRPWRTAQTIVADEGYLTESMMEPYAQDGEGLPAR